MGGTFAEIFARRLAGGRRGVHDDQRAAAAAASPAPGRPVFRPSQGQRVGAGSCACDGKRGVPGMRKGR